MIWFTLADGESIAVAPEHVRYIRPTENGGTTIFFSRDERFTVTQTPTEVAARLRETSGAAAPPKPSRTRAAPSRREEGR